MEIVKKEPLIANKQFYYVANFKSDFILKDNLSDFVMELYYIAKPLKDFLTNALNS